MHKGIFIVFICCGFLYSCGNSLTETTLDPPEPPFNPYDTIQYDNNIVEDIPIDSSTFLGLYTYIFSSSCNQPACHDGTFEPDFRTVQSAYHTLVHHPVKKNFETNPMPYRVTPGEADRSMMYKRITEHNPPNFERMPSSGNALPNRQIELIRNWINNGAKDFLDNPPMPSSAQPNCYGVLAYVPALNNIRLDTNRGDNVYNPFVVPSGQTIKLWFLYFDTDINGEGMFGNSLSHNKILLSTDRLDMTNAVELDMQVDPTPLNVASAYSQAYPEELPHYQNVTFNPTELGFQSGDIVYMRTYVQDTDHTEPTEIPERLTSFFVKSYFSFYIP